MAWCRFCGVGSSGRSRYTSVMQHTRVLVAAVISWVACALVLAGCQHGGVSVQPSLSSLNPIGRAKAIVAISEAGDRSKVPLLVDRLEDEDEVVRLFAIQALVRLVGEDKGYRHYDRAPQRARAVRRWRSWLEARAAAVSPQPTQQVSIAPTE